MSHLATSSEEDVVHAGIVGGEKQVAQQHTTIEKVLQSNPLLESFGNAKTGESVPHGQQPAACMVTKKVIREIEICAPPGGY